MSAVASPTHPVQLRCRPVMRGEEEAKQNLDVWRHKSEENLQMGIEELRQDPMMAHLIAALEQGREIGHYGRLVFVMIARHFLSEHELLEYLMKDRDVDERKARSLLAQWARATTTRRSANA